jgi:hypothetical protein
MLAKSFVAPLDRLKILFQVTNMPFSLTSVREVSYTLVKNDGWTALWKGNGVMMLRVFPYAGIQFMVFDTLKNWLEPNPMFTHTTRSLVAGSTAGLVSTAATYPLDLCRARLAVMRNTPGGLTKVHTFPSILKGIVATKGVRGLYLGITPTLAGMMPYSGLAFTMNDHLRRLTKSATGKDVTVFQKLIAGGVSGLIAQSLTYPMDVTRRRMQTTGIVFEDIVKGVSKNKNERPVAGEGGRKITVLNVMKDVLRTQGFRGLYKGLTMNWVKGPMAFSVSFTTFDFIKGLLDKFDPPARLGEVLVVRRMSVAEVESDEAVVASLSAVDADSED